RTAPSYGLLKRSVLLLKIEKVRCGSNPPACPSVFLVLRLEDHQPVWLWVRQRLDKPSVDVAEYCGICANPQRESEDSDCSKSRGFPQHAEAIAQILNQAVDQVDAAGFAAFLFGALNAAKLNPRPPQRLFSRHAAPH